MTVAARGGKSYIGGAVRPLVADGSASGGTRGVDGCRKTSPFEAAGLQLLPGASRLDLFFPLFREYFGASRGPGGRLR